MCFAGWCRAAAPESCLWGSDALLAVCWQLRCELWSQLIIPVILAILLDEGQAGRDEWWQRNRKLQKLSVWLRSDRNSELL